VPVDLTWILRTKNGWFKDETSGFSMIFIPGLRKYVDDWMFMFHVSCGFFIIQPWLKLV